MAQAPPSAGGDDNGAASASPAVSRRRAIAIARKRVAGGRVEEAERDEEDGRQVWKVKLARAGGVEREVVVAVDTGEVLKVERTATATATLTTGTAESGERRSASTSMIAGGLGGRGLVSAGCFRGGSPCRVGC